MKPRSLASLLRWVLPLAMTLACTERAAETRPSPSSSEAKVAEPAKAEPTKAEVATPSEPTKAAAPVPPTEAAPPSEPAEPAAADGEEPAPPPELTDAERVDAYVASCSHRFTVVPEVEVASKLGETVDECDIYPWDQNCVGDPSGCWDAGQECIRGCGKPCNACQDECAGGCDQCKAACAPGSTDCIRKCAEERLTCRTKCMTAHSECQSTDCPKQETACEKAFEKKIKKKCPQCTAISECMVRENDEEDAVKTCAGEFPKANKECFDWCGVLYAESAEDDGGL